MKRLEGAKKKRVYRKNTVPGRQRGKKYPEAVKTAATIASMPPMAAMVNNDMVNAAFETTLDQGIIYERRLFQILAATEDKAEGMAAFIEKREGVWKGR